MTDIVAKDRQAKLRRKQSVRRELTRILAVLKGLGAQKVILFGSAATGNIRRASDIDLIVVKETDKRFLDRLDEVYAAIEPRIATDILVYTPEEFESLKAERAFVRKAVEEGQVLYEASTAG